MVKALFIPVDEDLPLEIREFASLKDYQEAVGGNIEVLDIDRPAATIFINEEGKNLHLDTNRRATMLLWLHLSRFRGMDVLAGDVVVAGQPDEEGDTQDVPQELLDLLFNTTNYKVEVTTISEPNTWSGNQARYDSWLKAYMAGLSLAERWAMVDNVRVVAA